MMRRIIIEDLGRNQWRCISYDGMYSPTSSDCNRQPQNAKTLMTGIYCHLDGYGE